MKKVFIALALLLNCVLVLSQQTTPENPMTKEDYLQKSKSQKTAAWILMGGGAAMAIGGGIWFSETFSIDLFGPDRNPGEGTAGIIMFAGIGAMGGSIPLFIASARNKRKAIAMAFVINEEEFLGSALMKVKAGKMFPALTFRISLK